MFICRRSQREAHGCNIVHVENRQMMRNAFQLALGNWVMADGTVVQFSV